MADTGKIQPAPEAGRELDVAVAERVLGLDVRGEATAVFVEGEWSVHADSGTEGWLCYAGKEPVYCESYDREPPTLKDALEFMEYGATEQRCHERYARDKDKWDRDHERWGCSRYDLYVVPEYSTDPGEALRHVWPKILERADGAVAILYSSAPAHPGSPGAGYRIVRGGHYWGAFEIDPPDVTAPTMAEAICRFALALYPEPSEEP